MSQLHYYETVQHRMLLEAIAIRRQEVLEELAQGVDYDAYIKAIGYINGLEEAVNIAKSIQEKVRSSK